MHVLICPDKFKECMTAGRVAKHIRNGIIRAMPDADCRLIPMADGGEGTVEAMTEAMGGRVEHFVVHDPLMQPVDACIGITADGTTAVIEMAAASGLALLKAGEKNPLVTTTYGTGELIRHALERNCTRIVLGIGGSATVDGGVGMAQAMGVRFLDELGQDIGCGGGSLNRLSHIDLSRLNPRLSKCTVHAACDVTNPLTGINGAAAIYGPQKGATPAMVRQLDANLEHLAQVIELTMQKDVKALPGAGAAGGMGAGIAAFLNGELKPGFELISQTVNLEKWIRWADVVVTGEGKMDRQTAFGKTPAGVAEAAGRLNKPVIAFSGYLGAEPCFYREMGFAAVIPIADKPMTLEQSVSDAGILLEKAAERAFRLIALGKIL